MKLVIVESPAKSKTIQGYLGEDYIVESSIGHIRDLKVKGKGGFGVDIENNFTPEYEILPDKLEVVQKLRELAKESTHVYLASDPDREGEAIAWHLQEILEQPSNKVSRVVFNEITKPTVLNGIQNDREVNLDLVKSQETRRILDRIIGFRLSSLMQQKIGSKSAGRVQSVALKLVCDREKEIDAFSSVEYWELIANLRKDEFIIKSSFVGKKNNKSFDKIDLTNKEQTIEISNQLKQEYKVFDVIKKERFKQSKPPFITSTLQQDASAKYNYGAKRVMTIAQRLYEGIDLDNERVGLITYMRTDSTRLSDLFIESAKNHIINKYGQNYYNAPKNQKKGVNIQDAHEAIRPTHVEYTPEKIKKYLSLEEYKIYSLIYNRAVASLMTDAKVEDTKLLIENNGYVFQANGQKVLYDGYLKLYEETSIDNQEQEETLPEIMIGEVLPLVSLESNQKFTNPPSRYSEARLIRKMEELGIGRPSTYAITMETLKVRNYAKLEKKTFIPTEQGKLTSEQLDLFFNTIINVEYTKEMEQILDEIAEGKHIWYEELGKFYNTFSPLIENARDNMIKIYPKHTDEFCPDCGMPLFIRNGPFGEFTCCSDYPKCKFIKKPPRKNEIPMGIKCPLCNEGEVVQRTANKGRSKGQIFFACNRYPHCKATFSGLPTGEKCPKCNSFMIEKEGNIICGNPKCPSNNM